MFRHLFLCCMLCCDTLFSTFAQPRKGPMSGFVYETDGMRMELFASYQLDYEHSRTRQTALDITSPIQEIDPTNTYNYTYNYTTHWERFAYRINSSLYRLNRKAGTKGYEGNNGYR